MRIFLIIPAFSFEMLIIQQETERNVLIFSENFSNINLARESKDEALFGRPVYNNKTW
jgi:hypothetical protein